MKKLLLLLLLTVTGSFAQEGKAKFKAIIENRVSDSLVVYWIDYRQVIKATPGKDFEAVLPLSAGNIYFLTDGTNRIKLTLRDGDDLEMRTDATDFYRQLDFSGVGCVSNEHMAFSYKPVPEKWESKIDSAKYAASRIANENFENLAKRMDKREAMKKQAEKLKGKDSPEFTFKNHKGGSTSLADLKGKYVLIDVWATWCGPCRAEIPSLEILQDEFGDKNIAFVSISIDKEEDHKKWYNLVAKNDMRGIQLVADKDWKSDFVVAYGIKAIPRFILISPEGTIIDAMAKKPSDPELTKQLASLLN